MEIVLVSRDIMKILNTPVVYNVTPIALPVLQINQTVTHVL